MARELKVRIDDVDGIKKKLCNLGAFIVSQDAITDTYFKQPEGKVLKLSQTRRGNFLTSLHAENGGFVIDKSEGLENPEETKKVLEQQFGIKCILEKRVTTYNYKSSKISIHRIRDVGDFVIVESENPDKKIITELLKIPNPEYITESFDELKK